MFPPHIEFPWLKRNVSVKAEVSIGIGNLKPNKRMVAKVVKGNKNVPSTVTILKAI